MSRMKDNGLVSEDDRDDSITIAILRADSGVLSIDHLEAVILEVAAREGFTVEDLSVVIAGHSTVTDLNRKHLDREYEIDVLAFDLASDNANSENSRRVEGEIYIDLDTAKERAPEFGTSFEEEVRRYVIHGLLHLMGYRDDTPEGKSQMRDLENLYLGLQVRSTEVRP